MTIRLPTPDDTTPGTHARTVVGLFTSRPDAEQAIGELKAAGFTDAQIGVAMQSQDQQKELTQSTGGTAAKGAATGAMSGGVVGGLIGLLGSLLIPGVGPIVVGGVLASALTGASLGAATGGIIGGLMGLDVPEADARHFDQGIRVGGVIVTVDAGDRLSEALAILERNDVDLGPSRGQRFRGGVEAASIPASPTIGSHASHAYGGKERRHLGETTYSGPERRAALV